MIFEGIFTLLTALVTWLVGFTPAGGPWLPDLSPVSSFLGSVYAADAYLPITEIFYCMTIATAMMSARQLLTVSMFLYRRLRG